MTAQDVFDIAIRLMDENNESTGSTDTTDTKAYRVKACSILNAYLDEVYALSTTYTPVAGEACVYPQSLTDLSEELELDENLCRGVLPYALACELARSDANTADANYFSQMYEKRILDVKRRGQPAEFEDIEDEYGGLEYGEFSGWNS